MLRGAELGPACLWPTGGTTSAHCAERQKELPQRGGGAPACVNAASGARPKIRTRPPAHLAAERRTSSPLSRRSRPCAAHRRASAAASRAARGAPARRRRASRVVEHEDARPRAGHDRRVPLRRAARRRGASCRGHGRPARTPGAASRGRGVQELGPAAQRVHEQGGAPGLTAASRVRHGARAARPGPCASTAGSAGRARPARRRGCSVERRSAPRSAAVVGIQRTVSPPSTRAERRCRGGPRARSRGRQRRSIVDELARARESPASSACAATTPATIAAAEEPSPRLCGMPLRRHDAQAGRRLAPSTAEVCRMRACTRCRSSVGTSLGALAGRPRSTQPGGADA